MATSFFRTIHPEPQTAASDPPVRVVPLPTGNGQSRPLGTGGTAARDHAGPDEVSSTELMEQVRDGNVRAFERLVGRYWSPTLAYVRHLTRDPDRAYEVTQEAFSRLWERRVEWKTPGSVRVWLLRTARNLTISDRRSWKVRAQRAVEVALEYRPVRTPLEDVEDQELRAAIRLAVRKLSPRRREVFILFHLHGLSYREISALMGVRPQTATNYLQAALADLRILLAPFFHADGREGPRRAGRNREAGE